MKHALPTALLGVTTAMVCSCGNFSSSRNNQDLDPRTDPLDSPGRHREELLDVGPRYAPGTYVEVTDANAGIYRRFPRGNDQPSQKLKLGTQLKVVGEQGSYVKVETEAGEIGFVPAIMISDLAAETAPLVPSGEPVLVPTESIEPIDPAGLPPLPGAGDAPFVAPDPEVPPIEVDAAPPQPSTPSPGPEPTPEPLVPDE